MIISWKQLARYRRIIIKTFQIRPLKKEDNDWVVKFLIENWGSTRQVAYGKPYQPSEHPGFAAIQNGAPVGLITYQIRGGECQITILNSLAEKIGIGTALVDAVRVVATTAHCKSITVITTNDNMEALRFYQKRGFSLATLYRNAVEQSRKIKPEIPLTGQNGIQLQDEIELKLSL